jgi:hypothetical protein
MDTAVEGENKNHRCAPHGPSVKLNYWVLAPTMLMDLSLNL